MGTSLSRDRWLIRSKSILNLKLLGSEINISTFNRNRRIILYPQGKAIISDNFNNILQPRSMVGKIEVTKKQSRLIGKNRSNLCNFIGYFHNRLAYENMLLNSIQLKNSIPYLIRFPRVRLYLLACFSGSDADYFLIIIILYEI